jgi:flagellar biosynthetic protein FlhB
MSKDSLPEQRTEMPTERRLEEIRKEGAIFHSTDLEHVFVLIAGFLALTYSWKLIFTDMRILMVKTFRLIANTEPIDPTDLINGVLKLSLLVVPDLLIITGCVALVACLSVLLQTKWNKREKWIKFRWDLLNPLAGLKRIFSVHGLTNLLKAIIKLGLVLPIGYWALKGFAPDMVRLVHMSLHDVLATTGGAVRSAFWKVTYVLMAVAILDLAWGRFQWLRKNKMTKEEVKEERKSVEGDESMRRKMIAKGQQRLVNKLKSSVPKADVIITNPTHYAIALKYERDKFAAPIVVAKGTDFMAQRIREIAKENGIPIVERKALARALYASTEVGSEIPRELFRAVAEVLAYVFKRRRGGAAAVR